MRALFAALITAIAVVSGAIQTYTVVGVGATCPFGTNWDNTIHACR